MWNIFEERPSKNLVEYLKRLFLNLVSVFLLQLEINPIVR
jgi:hypothetical protein